MKLLLHFSWETILVSFPGNKDGYSANPAKKAAADEFRK